MKWLKAVFSFVIKHLPRWIHVAHEVSKELGECPDCEEVSDPCRDCELYEDCKWYDEKVKGSD